MNSTGTQADYITRLDEAAELLNNGRVVRLYSRPEMFAVTGINDVIYPVSTKSRRCPCRTVRRQQVRELCPHIIAALGFAEGVR